MEDTGFNWGTWEELVLGGAVLRHGIFSWDAVAAELRSRTFCPYYFSPEVCKAKYEDIQERYSGCTFKAGPRTTFDTCFSLNSNAWFEELRKQRVAELKREIEKSEGSIGSLESKLESLKCQKNADPNANYASGRTESPPSVGNLAQVSFPSKDGLSGSSATEGTQTDWSLECQVPVATLSTREAEMKLEEGENATSNENIVRKRRGKRKRKECVSKEFNYDLCMSEKDQIRSTGDCDRAVRSFNDDDDKVQIVRVENVNLMSLLDSILMQNGSTTLFTKRTDSQRRGRYKKTIRQHMDLTTIRSRISDRLIASTRELYRDLLLLCSNIIVFYSKESREYRAAISFREFLTKTSWQNVRVSGTCGGSSVPPSQQPQCNNALVKSFYPPVKLSNLSVKSKSAHSSNHKVAGKIVARVSPNRESKKACNAETPKEVVTKKGVDRPVKVGRTGGSKRVETPVNGRKRARRR
ncbi:hypothetical protein IFM89_014094 [Coptis chinensis]|uniref:Bromo domain-containing protein n=1 Tax=Coptis chinensis TaxID=261450 RepID=A0A835GYT7_9MAGN|nr:hypothetical protein IFM89_014094 [Coptis chinensis]